MSADAPSSDPSTTASGRTLLGPRVVLAGDVSGDAAGAHDAHALEVLRRASAGERLDPSPDGAALMLAALDLEARGVIRLAWPRVSARAPRARGRERANVTGEAADRRRFQRWFAFLEPDAPNFALKRLEAERYLELLTPHLPGGAPAVLDVGGATGRMALPLAARGARVTLVDPSEAALADAGRAIARAGADIAIAHGTAYDLGAIADASQDVVLAIEVLCYLEEPATALAELVRTVTPGGLVAVSVEAWPGALAVTEALDATALDDARATRTLHVPDDVFVRYFDRAELEALLAAAGLEPILVAPTHFLLDGCFAHALTDVDLADPAAAERTLALERRLAAEPSLAPLCRAWLALGRRPDPGAR